MKGKIVQVQRFSTQDGPGIRTTVFFKGCNLRCAWCHNPETVYSTLAIGWKEDLCVHCGACSAVCGQSAIKNGREDFFEELCVQCGKCVDVCPTNALEKFGEEIELEKLLAIIKRDIRYYQNSGGGVTASGGEPMLQWQFVKKFFKELKGKGISTALDTAGNIDYKYYSEVLPYTDLVLYDLKAMDPEIHKNYTGTGNQKIIGNLKQMLQEGVNVEIRIPVIVGVNDNLDNMQAVMEIISDFPNVKQVKLLPYHSLGLSKNLIKGYHKTQRFTEVEKEKMEELAEVFKGKAVY